MLVLFSTSFPVFADGESQNPDPNANGSAVLLLQSEYGDIKRMPSKYFLEIVYADGELSLFSNAFEGEFYLSFENYELGEKVEIPSIYVGESKTLELKCGEYKVKAISKDGKFFGGVMEIL